MDYWPILVIVLQLIFLEGILSIDNAAVIGALVSPLPDDQDVPWPGSFAKAWENIASISWVIKDWRPCALAYWELTLAAAQCCF